MEVLTILLTLIPILIGYILMKAGFFTKPTIVDTTYGPFQIAYKAYKIEGGPKVYSEAWQEFMKEFDQQAETEESCGFYWTKPKQKVQKFIIAWVCNEKTREIYEEKGLIIQDIPKHEAVIQTNIMQGGNLSFFYTIMFRMKKFSNYIDKRIEMDEFDDSKCFIEHYKGDPKVKGSLYKFVYLKEPDNFLDNYQWSEDVQEED